MSGDRRNRSPATIDGATGKPEKAPPQRTPPIKLDNLRNIRDELGRVYREARAGKIGSQDATRFAFVLGQLRDLVISMDIEQRLLALEEGSKNGRCINS